MLKKLLGLSSTVEILLFPWINVNKTANVLFSVLFIMNLLFSIYYSVKINKTPRLSLWKVFIIGFCLTILANPNSYWGELNLESPVVRFSLFFLRFLFFFNITLAIRSRLFVLGVLTSALLAIYGWTMGAGDIWRLNYPYGDANYQGFIYSSYLLLIILQWKKLSKTNKILVALASLTSFLVVVLGASRGSILALLIVFTIWLIFNSTLKMKFVMTSIIILGTVALTKTDLTKDIILIQRFVNPRSSDKGAADSRFFEIKSAFTAMISNPMTFIMGNGLSSSANNSIKSYGHKFRIHSTTMSVIYDSGIIGSVFFISSVLLLFRKIKNRSIVYLLAFMILNSQTFFVLTFYHFFICLSALTIKENYISLGQEM